MRLHRFYTLQPLGEEVVITDGSVLKQWKNVFRYTPSVFVILFNGDGNDYMYSIHSLSAKSCNLTLSKRFPSYIPTKQVSLYLSILKKDNFELVVQKATELGITSIIPVISSRSEKKNINEERLHKIIIESVEQCGRGDIPLISPIVSLSQALTIISKKDTTLFLQMGGVSWNDPVLQEKIASSSTLNIFIGPEGGWTDDEETSFQDIASTVSLGDTVLRAETAAITACALFR